MPRKTAKNSKTGTRKRNTKSNQKNNDTNFSKVKDEVIGLGVLALSILLFVANIGLGGMIGRAVSDFFFGIFGLLQYVFPLFLFGITMFIYVNRKNKKAFIKAGLLILIWLTTCTIIQLIMVPFAAGNRIMDYFQIGSKEHIGGGLVGGLVVDTSIPLIGTLGCYIVSFMILVIALILVTEISVLDVVKQKHEKVNRGKSPKRDLKPKESVRVKETTYADENDVAKYEKPRRSDKSVRGVTFDTTLKKPEELTEMRSEFPELTKEDIQNENLDEQVVDSIEKKPRKQRGKAKSIEEENQVAEIERVIIRNDSQGTYKFPPLTLLAKGKASSGKHDAQLHETAEKLQQTLKNFGVNVQITNYSKGPSVTRYELQPDQGVKVSKIVGLADDIKLNLAAPDIRIEAPIPGKAAVGIEVPNKENATVALRSLLENKGFMEHDSNISFAVGKDIGGNVVVTDIAKMPHLLIAGSTGSGKSVCINTLIMSILFKANPEDVKLIMIDPKVVELSVYNGIPHLLIPVVTDPKKAAGALHWAVVEMEKRYQLFAEYNVRDLKGYNKKVEGIKDIEDESKPEKMPQIVIIVDELADLMMVAPGDVEEAICRLAQLARAAGIHLILATQRPSVNVITGLIKANMPSRIAFAVSSGVDSRTIIDMNGAEKLLGKGDMLFYPSGYPKPARVQGAFVSDKEVQEVVEFLCENYGSATYNEEIEKHVVSNATSGQGGSGGVPEGQSDRDVYFVDAGKFIIEKDKASIGMLQRVFKIGFNRAARIMDQLCEAGVVGEEEGTKPRKVLMSIEEFEQYIEEYV